MQQFKITVKGKVQGVGFRAFILKKAQKYNIDGTVKNCTNGNVKIMASASSQAMDVFIRDCHKGPLFAQVKDLNIIELDNSIVFTPNFRIID